ncbi:MAG: apolipoprotein N-acyltransferase [Pseudomonadota bacterium]
MTAIRQFLLAALNQGGWKRRGLAFFAGIMAALSQAPFYLLPAMAVGLSLLILLVHQAQHDKRPLRAAFSAGWFFGFGYYLLGIYWMAFSFFVQAEQFAWMAPFAMTGMPAFLALFMGAAMVCTRYFTPLAGGLTFTSCYMFFEYLRGHVLTGLPWNLPAQALAGTAAGAQTVAWVGAYGLSFILVLISVYPGAHIVKHGMQRMHIAKAAMIYGIGLIVIFAIGGVRLSVLPARDHEDVAVRIVQPNIPQKEKIDPALWARNVERSLEQSTAPTEDGVHTYVLWPENAAPVIDEAPNMMQSIGTRLPGNSTLLTGGVRRQTMPERDGNSEINNEGTKTRFFNGLAILPINGPATGVSDWYHKHHLVPFGEYLPMRGVLQAIGLAQLAPYEDGFTKGEGPVTFAVGPAPFAPLICYEAIFPGAMYPRSDRPQWIAAVTNDAWFGDTSGPRQHLAQTRLRAIEEGLPIARSANTGISALIDGTGRIRRSIPLYEAGVISARLPMPEAPTLYSRVRDWPFALMVLFGLGASFATARGNLSPLVR